MVSVYVDAENLKYFIDSLPAIIIDYDLRTLSVDDSMYNSELSDVEQIAVEIYVYCSKSDDEADYQWWEQSIAELAEASKLDSGNVNFIIYPDDENNPNSDI